MNFYEHCDLTKKYIYIMQILGLQVVDMLRPVSNLSVLKDLVREEMSPNIDESRKKSAMKNTDSARKSSKRVRFDESVEQNNKVINIGTFL